MMLVRFVCQAKVGKASEVVAGFKQANEIARMPAVTCAFACSRT